MSTPRVASISARRAVSRPWSQVRVLTRWRGWRPSAAVTASAVRLGVVTVGQADCEDHPAGALGEGRYR